MSTHFYILKSSHLENVIRKFPYSSISHPIHELNLSIILINGRPNCFNSKFDLNTHIKWSGDITVGKKRGQCWILSLTAYFSVGYNSLLYSKESHWEKCSGRKVIWGKEQIQGNFNFYWPHWVYIMIDRYCIPFRDAYFVTFFPMLFLSLSKYHLPN